MAHINLGLKAVQKGAEHIPDRAFEKIPYVGPKYFREDEERRRQRNRKNSRDSSSDGSSYGSDGPEESEAERGALSSRRHRQRSDKTNSRQNRDVKDRGYESDQGPGGYADAPYFPPPPQAPGQQAAYIPRKYNPDEYGADTGTRDQYYSGHPQERAPYVPPQPPGPPGQQYSGPASGASGTSRSPDPDRRSSIADRYRPSNYNGFQAGQLVARQDSPYRGASPSSLGQAVALRRGSQPNYMHPDHGHSYVPPDFRDGEDDGYYDRQDRRGSSGRRSSRHDSRDEGRGVSERFDDTALRVKGELKKHKKDIGASAIGALAGSIIGNQFAPKDSKMGLLMGAALGGIGGGLLERKHENDKRRRMERRSSARSQSERRKDGYESY